MCVGPLKPPKPAPPPPPPPPPKVKETPTVSDALTTQVAPSVAKKVQKGDTNGVREETRSRVATRKRAGRRQLRIPLLPSRRPGLISGDDSGINLPM